MSCIFSNRNVPANIPAFKGDAVFLGDAFRRLFRIDPIRLRVSILGAECEADHEAFNKKVTNMDEYFSLNSYEITVN